MKQDKATTTAIMRKIRAQHEEPLAFAGMTVALSGCIVLCAINPPLLDNITLQSLTSATFAISGAILYVLYMIISKMVALVFMYIETAQYRKRGTLLRDEDDTDGLLLSDSVDYEEEEEEPVAQSLPREAVISSMYLGGSGSFLAIAPLCMWDISISAAFALSLLVVAFLDGGKIPTEFRIGVDTVSAIANIKRLRFLLQFSIFSMLLCILWLDSQDRKLLISTPQTSKFFVVGGQWPLVLLSASSPFLLRGGGGRVLRGMSPSQTLETALPVCTLLAFLILCWYGPVEKIILAHFISPLSTLLPMLILCPPCLSATLAFVLYSLKNRRAVVSAGLLTFALFIRQQILTEHHMLHKMDWMALSSVLNILASSIFFWLYKRKVLWQHKPPPSTTVVVDLQTT